MVKKQRTMKETIITCCNCGYRIGEVNAWEPGACPECGVVYWWEEYEIMGWISAKAFFEEEAWLERMRKEEANNG